MSKFRRPPNRRPPPPSHPASTPHESSGPTGTVEGVLDVKGAVGFILSEKPGVPDVLIQGPSLGLAMSGDRVEARIKPGNAGGRRVGDIVRVVKRARETVVGTFEKLNGVSFLVVENSDTRIRLASLGSPAPREGELAVARITTWPTPGKMAVGSITEVIGVRGRPGVDRTALVRKYELPDAFQPATEAEARAFGEEVPEDVWKTRETLFDKTVFTIDGADAKDFDDAVSIETRPGGGWRMGIHIADVANYVQEGTSLDREAYERGTSVYLTGSVLPMLPFALSDNLCSLRPHVVRLTLSCFVDLDVEGRVLGHRIAETAIRSAKRFTYEEVEAILNDKPSPLPAHIISDVRAMGNVARLLRKRRFARGSLDFDLPEANVTLDPHGRPTDIQRRQRLEAHRLIEDFMLLANETVAEHMKDAPFLYRVHDRPDPAKMEKLKLTLSAVGIPIPRGFDGGEPLALQRVISFTEGRPIQAMVQMMTLRSLKQAVYSEINRGHYGLASDCYTHFTSPIRRYPDLVVHRLIKERLHRMSNPEREREWQRRLPTITLHTSRRERVAVEAEREYMDFQRARFMEDRVGKEYDGVVSGVTNFGLFVQLSQVFVEGLIRVSDLDDDYYILDEIRMMLRGKRTGRSFHVGQPVRVRLVGINLTKHQLDFQLIGQTRSTRPSGSGPTHASQGKPHHEHRGHRGKSRRHERRRKR